MTVTVTKPQATLRELLAGLKKKTGLFGEQVMRAETSADFYSVLGANRNLLPNGDFKVWQRGVSQSKSGGSYVYFGPDQVVSYYIGTYEQTNVTLPNGVHTTAFKNTLGSGSVAPNVNFPIENGGKFLRGQTVTASWWMRASKARTMQNRFNSVAQANYGGAGYALYDLVANQVNTTWTYYTRTFTMPASLPYDHANFEIFGNTSDWTQNDWFEIAQVQVELGSTASPFERRNIQQDLSLCQRYYYEDWIYMQAYQITGQDYSILVRHPVTMRTSPSITVGTALINVNTTSQQIATTPGAPDTTKGFRPYIRTSSSGLIEYNAKYTASAEF